MGSDARHLGQKEERKGVGWEISEVRTGDSQAVEEKRREHW